MIKLIIVIFVFHFSMFSMASQFVTHVIYFKLDRLQESIELYMKDCPISSKALNSLEELIYSSEGCWKGPYIREKDRKDRYNRRIVYIDYKGSKVLVSSGKDGAFNTEDDMRSDDNKERRREIYWYYKTNNKIFTKYIFIQYPVISLLIFLIIVLIVLGTKKGR